MAKSAVPTLSDDLLKQPLELAAALAREHVKRGGSTDDGIVLVSDPRDEFGFAMATIGLMRHHGVEREEAEAKLKAELDEAGKPGKYALRATWFDIEAAEQLLLGIAGDPENWREWLIQTIPAGEVAVIYADGKHVSFNVIPYVEN